MRGGLRDGLEQGERELLEDALGGEVEHPGRPDERDGQQPGGPVPGAEPEQQGGEREVERAQGRVGDDLRPRRDVVGGVRGTLGDAGEPAAGQRLVVQPVVQGRQVGGGDGQRALGQQDQRPGGVPGEGEHEQHVRRPGPPVERRVTHGR